MKILSLFLICFSLHAYSSENKVALAKVVKGDVKEILENGESKILKNNEWISEGSVVQTAAKSFVQLKFIDDSQVNVGPQSEMKIEQFSKTEPGVLNVLKGKIRSKITKNYLDMEKDQSKLFVKSNTAVMGVRGTDFIFGTSKKNGRSTAILFEGSVVFNRLREGAASDRRVLEKIVNEGRRLVPGQFSVVTQNSRPTVPAKLNSEQFNKLYKNEDLKKSEGNETKRDAKKSVVPPGLSGDLVSSSQDGQKNLSREEREAMKGYKNGDDFKPVDGSFVHLDSGTIVPMTPDAEFNSATSEWVSRGSGVITSEGEYLPPSGYTMTDEGRLIKETSDTALQKQNKVVEVQFEAAPLNEAVAFDKLPTTIVDSSVVNQQTHAPANSGSSEIIIPETNPGNVIEKKSEEQNSINSVPKPAGTGYKPDSYNSAPPKAPGPGAGAGNQKSKTRTRIIIKQ